MDKIDNEIKATEKLLDNDEEIEALKELSVEEERYHQAFNAYTEKHKEILVTRKGMIEAARMAENEAEALRKDQKNEMKNDFSRSRVEKADDANRLIKYVNQCRIAEKNFIMRHKPKYIEELNRLFAAAKKQITITRSKMKRKINQDQMDNMMIAFNKYQSNFEANHKIAFEKEELEGVLLKSAKTFVDKAATSRRISKENLNSRISTIQTSIMTMLVLSIVLGIVVAVFISSAIKKGINGIIDQVNDVVSNILEAVLTDVVIKTAQESILLQLLME